MDKFFDRLGELLRSFLKTDSDYTADPDLREAWEELDDYLRTGRNRPGRRPHTRAQSSRSPFPEADAGLKQDYANLEVSFGASFEEVKRSYKSLLKAYHPDRFAADPDKQRLATQITQKLNGSFQRIKEFTMKHQKKGID